MPRNSSLPCPKCYSHNVDRIWCDGRPDGVMCPITRDTYNFMNEKRDSVKANPGYIEHFHFECVTCRYRFVMTVDLWQQRFNARREMVNHLIARRAKYNKEGTMTRSATAQAALVLRDLLGENHASANLAAIRDQDGNVSYAIHCDRKDEGKLLFEHGLSIEQLLDLADEIVQQGSDHPGFRTVEVDSEGNQTTDLEQGSARNEELMPGEIPDLPPGYIDERLAAGNPDLHGNPTRTDNPELVPANPTTPPASDE